MSIFKLISVGARVFWSRPQLTAAALLLEFHMRLAYKTGLRRADIYIRSVFALVLKMSSLCVVFKVGTF